MKKIILLFLLITSTFSSDKNYELKLYEKVLSNIFQKSLLIYSDKYSKDILQNSSILKLTINCTKADILIGKRFGNLPTLCQDKPIFSTSYQSFISEKNAIGAFYWRKGRPQIKFKLDTLQNFNLELPRSLMEFAQ